MTTEKQIQANRENALVSTGPKTEEGKALVSQNAIKHGIFTRDLIIDKGDGKEDLKEYQELLKSLIEYFSPKGQLEFLLVEKIAVDFWRLRRIVRFETGSIRLILDNAIENYYAEADFAGKPIHKRDSEFDKEISELTENLDWDENYLKYLEKDEVDLTKDSWENDEIEADIQSDYFAVINPMRYRLEGLNRDAFESGEMPVKEMRSILNKNGYDLEGIKNLIIEYYKSEIDRLNSEIDRKKAQKAENRLREEVQTRLKVLPPEGATEKIMKYERSIEKAIFQKIVMLKNLQRVVAD